MSEVKGRGQVVELPETKGDRLYRIATDRLRARLELFSSEAANTTLFSYIDINRLAANFRDLARQVYVNNQKNRRLNGVDARPEDLLDLTLEHIFSFYKHMLVFIKDVYIVTPSFDREERETQLVALLQQFHKEIKNDLRTESGVAPVLSIQKNKK